MSPTSFAAKVRAAEERCAALGSAIVAFSGGLDSAVVLALAVRGLGRANVLAVTGRSPSVPARDLANVAALAGEIGAAHQFHDTSEFDDPNYVANPQNRCFFCKTEMDSGRRTLAAQRGLAAVISGTNADDLGDYRPGLQAAADHAVAAPLAEAGLTKADVRRLAAEFGLSIHDKPAAPCLASRIPYGEPVTVAKLARIDAAEDFLRDLGFRECRVRHHADLARIEVSPADLPRLLEPALRAQVDAHLRRLGFAYVAVDLRGFRSGSLNEVILGAALR